MSIWNEIKSKAVETFNKLKKVGHVELIIAIVAIGLILLVYFGSSCSSSQNASINSESGEYDYCAGVVKELETKLSQSEGAGEVSVLIYWKETAEGDDNLYVPEGVIIICDGGKDIAVKMRLISSVAAYLGISENKINVLAKSN